MLTQSTLGRFELRDLLGRGAIGDVHLAWDPQRQGPVALKVIHRKTADPEMLDAEKKGLALQAQLARVAPQVAAVYEQGEEGGLFWVAMEYVDGEDLSQILARGPLDARRAAGIALQLCRMLEVSHGFAAEVDGRAIHGIVHGDIKPENIRLQADDRVRVLDFGIAKHLSHTRRFTVNLFGSLPYTPPERLERGVVDRNTDLWAVGVVLYGMLSGRRPFDGETPEELEKRIRAGDPFVPLPENCPPPLCQVVARSLAFAVEQRYGTAAELAADLAAYLNGEPLPSETVGRRDPGDLDATRRTVPPWTGRSETGDLDATRRTDRPLPGSDAPAATQRTGPAGVPGPPPMPSLAAESTGPLPSPKRRRRWLPLALLAVAAAWLVAQLWVAAEARQIGRVLATEPSPDLAPLLERYRQADRWSVFNPALSGVRAELRDAYLRSADRIFASYRGDSPTTTERGWLRARELMTAAVELNTRDRAARARLAYSQAHLDRIESQGLRKRGERQLAAEKLRDAVAGFQEAASRDRAWPDPFLGLARLYAYDQFNLQGLQSALEELKNRGYPPGRREQAMLADGYRTRGIELVADAQQRRGTDDETALLQRARDHFRKAKEIYGQMPNYGDSRRNLADVELRLAGIDRREAVIRGDVEPAEGDEENPLVKVLKAIVREVH